MHIIFLSIIATAIAIDNGIGRTPPMGWRSWNQFHCNINQEIIDAHFKILAKDINGTSLLNLGYRSAGIDDCWQKCNSGPGGKGFHNASGYPIVDTDAFPDMKALTASAKSLKIVPGWYGNNCKCKDTVCKSDKCFRGDVQATLDFGFESIKLDGCGVEKNITKFAALFNATGVPVMIENCFNGNPTHPSSRSDCPMNFFRSSRDIRPSFGSVLYNLRSTMSYNGKNITGPGCWAYPDMLEVGVTNSQGLPALSFTEARTHFGAWCIVSSPLILGLDLRNSSNLKAVWPIITNEEAIKVNQAWAGDAGVLVAQSTKKVRFFNCSWSNNPCDHESWMIWKKKIADYKVAVLLMNNANITQSIAVNFTDIGLECGTQGCNVRDIWRHKDDPMIYSKSSLSVTIDSTDSEFLIITEKV